MIFLSEPQYGIDWTGATDSTAALQSVAAAVPHGETIVFPQGTIKLSYEIQWSKHAISLIGAGKGQTLVRFNPSSSKTCFKFEIPAACMIHPKIKGIGFVSDDTQYTKTAIEIIDVTGAIVEDVGTAYPHWMGAGSTFLNIKGREIGSVRNVYAMADSPIVCEPIPSSHNAAGIGIDHHNFHDMYLIAGSGYPVVTFASGLNMTNISFTGYQAWVGGSYGLLWADTTSTGGSSGLRLENIRWEQGSHSTGWLVYITHNYLLRGLVIKNCEGGDRNGILLRKVWDIDVEDFRYTSTTGCAMNVDASVKRISLRNCFWQAGSTSAMAGQNLVLGSPISPVGAPIPPNAIYSDVAGGGSGGGAWYPTPIDFGGTVTSTTGVYSITGGMCFFTARFEGTNITTTLTGSRFALPATPVSIGHFNCSNAENTQFVPGVIAGFAYPGTLSATNIIYCSGAFPI